MLVRSISVTQHRKATRSNNNIESWECQERQRQAVNRQRKKVLDSVRPTNVFTTLLNANDNIIKEVVETVKTATSCTKILDIRVRGHLFQTREATLDKYPTTLLGKPSERVRFYNKATDEYVFDRCYVSFDAILFYYQSKGILARPANVRRAKFIEELAFFQISVPLDDREEKEERYEEKEVARRHHEVPQSKMQEFIWRKVCFKDNPRFRNASYFFYCFILSLSGVSITFEPTYPSRILWFIMEVFLGTIYTLEYIIRIYISNDARRYLVSIMGLIDFVSMTMTQLYVILHLCKPPVTPLVKVSLAFRVLKCTRVCRGVLDLWNVMWACREFIVLFVGTALSLCVIASALIQHIEEEQGMVNGRVSHTHVDFINWLWYSVITVTGVGYGDYYPKTTPGKVVGGTLSVCGMLLFCMAATQLVYKFVDVYYMPDVLGYTSRGKKREVITAIRDEFLQDIQQTRGNFHQ